MEKKEIVKDVVEQIINMLDNNVLAEYGSEGFECWCDGGKVFEDAGLDDIPAHKEVMEKLAPFVDRLSEEIDDELGSMEE